MGLWGAAQGTCSAVQAFAKAKAFRRCTASCIKKRRSANDISGTVFREPFAAPHTPAHALSCVALFAGSGEVVALGGR